MAALPRITVADPQNILDTYGAGALVRLERGTSAAMTDASEQTTIAVLATKFEYEYRDQTGVAGSSWYRVRYSTATPTLPEHYSGYSDTALASAVPSAYTTPALAKMRLNKSQASTADDDVLWSLADEINADVGRRIGYFVGPSDDTTRLYSGRSAQIHGGRRLYVPGGIRTLTGVRIASSSDGTLVSVSTVADFHLGPDEWDGGVPGEPYHYVEITDNPSGDYGTFPDALRNVELTGTFGWSEVPGDLSGLATRQLVRAYLSRSSGQTDVVGSDQMGNAVISRLWSQPDLLMIANYRNKAR